MTIRRPTTLVLLASLAALAVGTAPTPLWDEDEPRFAAIARTMVETGDWIVPIYNDTLAVDKPVLMHWCMAAAMSVFGVNEFAARLPSVLATLLTALVLLRAGTRWFDATTGVVAALAFVGCLLVGIEAHAATPDAILTALTAWATLLAAEALVPARNATAGDGTAAAGMPRLSAGRAAAIGAILGLAVVCKGPIGFVGPLAVIVPWTWWLATARRLGGHATGLRDRAAAALVAIPDMIRSLRPFTLGAAMLAAAAPWYLAVSIRTGGEWTAGFFFVHNVGRFLTPMEKHGGSAFFHPLAMLVGFFPWSCFLPLAIVVAGRRVWKRNGDATTNAVLGLLLVWMAVWVGGFSAAATKLPNYVLPAYPAAAFLVAVLAVEAVRREAWQHPRWMASGLGWLAFGGLATSATVLVTVHYGLTGAEPAALVGLIPLAGALACGWFARSRPAWAVGAFVVTGLVYTSLAVGPASWLMGDANALPGFVRRVQARQAAPARIGTYMMASPNVVFYARGHVEQIGDFRTDDVSRFLHSGPDALLLIPEQHVGEIAPVLPAGYGIVARTRPLFRDHDVVAVGLSEDGGPRTAGTRGTTR